VDQPTAANHQSDDRERVLEALLGDRTVDIITTGARTGTSRTTEIWTTVIGGEVFLCGTPNASLPGVERKPRDWLANLVANPRFTLRLKSTVHADLAAEAEPVSDAGERRRIMSAPATEYYRSQAKSIEHAARESPIVRLRFVEGDAWLTEAVRAAAADRS
jgi:deazaflavin-dependent oxidoreductase (nitroreductase family)